MKYEGFIGQSYTLQAFSADCQQTVNLYPQADESGTGKNAFNLFSTPGLKKVQTYADVATGPMRGAYWSSVDRFFVVVGDKLFEVASDFSSVRVLALPGEAGRTSTVCMTDNGLAMMIACGPTGYWFDFTTNAVTQIADEVFKGADKCGFIDGFIVFNEPGTQNFWITQLYDTVIDPLGFAAVEGSPDKLLSLLVDHKEIWLFGEISTEIWFNSGNANFPFAEIQGSFISHGIAAKDSAQRLDNTVFWLGEDEFGNGMVWRANAYAPVRCSTHAMEQAIQRYPTIKDATSFTYQQDGHSFYVLNFPSGDATWVYDAATNLWHERAFLGTLTVNDGNLHRGRPNMHAFAFEKHIVGDWETGTIYEMSPKYFDDDVREIPRIRTAPFINNERKRITFDQFELDMDTGLGDAGGGAIAPVEPEISLTFSDDGGHTWSNENVVSMGKSGEYRKRVVWRRLGQSRERVYRVKASQRGVPLNLYDAYLELSPGTS